MLRGIVIGRQVEWSEWRPSCYGKCQRRLVEWRPSCYGNVSVVCVNVERLVWSICGTADALVLLLLLVLTVVTATIVTIFITTVILPVLICGTNVLLFSSTFHFLVVQGDVATNDILAMVHAREVLSHNFIVTLNVLQLRFMIGGLEEGNDITIARKSTLLLRSCYAIETT